MFHPSPAEVPVRHIDNPQLILAQFKERQVDQCLSECLPL